jgi:hypothetical protein
MHEASGRSASYLPAIGLCAFGQNLAVKTMPNPMDNLRLLPFKLAGGNWRWRTRWFLTM